MAHQAGVTEVNINRQEITLRMYKNAGIDTTGIPGLIDRYKGRLFSGQGKSPPLSIRIAEQKQRIARQ